MPDLPTTGDLVESGLPTSGFPAIGKHVSPGRLTEYPTGLDDDTRRVTLLQAVTAGTRAVLGNPGRP